MTIPHVTVVTDMPLSTLHHWGYAYLTVSVLMLASFIHDHWSFKKWKKTYPVIDMLKEKDVIVNSNVGE